MWLIVLGTILVVLLAICYLLAMGLIKELNRMQDEESSMN